MDFSCYNQRVARSNSRAHFGSIEPFVSHSVAHYKISGLFVAHSKPDPSPILSPIPEPIGVLTYFWPITRFLALFWPILS